MPGLRLIPAHDAGEDCPHSLEWIKDKALLAGVEDSEKKSFFTMTNKDRMSREEDDIILFTSNNKKIRSLGSETLGKLLLDRRCKSNVCSEAWWLDFYKNLTEKDKVKVKVKDSDKNFRFGGGMVLTGDIPSTAGW